MVKVRHGIWILSLVFVLAFIALSGCAPQIACEKPNSIVGNSCCVDFDSNGVCDTKEEVKETVKEVESQPVVEEVGPSEIEVFASTFARTWDGKSYTALHSLFDKDLRLRMTAREFNFLARKMHTNLGISGVSLQKIDGNDAYYEVTEGEVPTTVVAPIMVEDGQYRHSVFSFFEALDAATACGEDGQCFFDFAKITGNKNYCESAGDKRLDCLAELGVSKSLQVKIDECTDISDYYAKVECLEDVAAKENTVEPCWEAEYDKQIFMCMGLVVAKRGDVKECSEVVSSRGFPANRIQHAYCILRYVKETGEDDACALIDRGGDVIAGALQEGCYRFNFP